jgi:hypothetical protein
MTYMKPQSKFLVDGLNSVFGQTITKVASLSAEAAADPTLSALTDMDKAAEILETLGLVKEAGKVVRVMDKVSKKMKKKMDVEKLKDTDKDDKKTKKDKNVE